jgi:hypothetical protein
MVTKTFILKAQWSQETTSIVKNGHHCIQRRAPTTVVHCAVFLARFSCPVLYAVHNLTAPCVSPLYFCATAGAETQHRRSDREVEKIA